MRIICRRGLWPGTQIYQRRTQGEFWPCSFRSDQCNEIKKWPKKPFVQILLFLMLLPGDVNTDWKGLGWKQRKMRLLLFRMSPHSSRKCIIYTTVENHVLCNVEDLRCFSSSTQKKTKNKQHKTTPKIPLKIDLVWVFFFKNKPFLFPWMEYSRKRA